MARSRRLTRELYRCRVCRAPWNVYRGERGRRPRGHLKTMWCARCRAMRIFRRAGGAPRRLML